MAVIDLSSMPASGVLLGLDPGAKTIGVAASDRMRLVASPVEVIARGRRMAGALERLLALLDAREGVGLVVGLALNMDGSQGPRAQAARGLAHNILARRDLPIAFQDERLTTAQAERAMIEADLSRARRARSLDASAAAILLQAALDRLANARDTG